MLEGPLPGALLASLERTWLQRLEAALAAGRTPVLFSSRGELACRSAGERRRLGLELAALMARLAAGLAPRLGYLISKGGITTHTLLADGLGAGLVELQGQLLPGLSLVLLPAGDRALAGLPLLTFPGNLGDAGTLRQAWRRMEGLPLEEAGLPPGNEQAHGGQRQGGEAVGGVLQQGRGQERRRHQGDQQRRQRVGGQPERSGQLGLPPPQGDQGGDSHQRQAHVEEGGHGQQVLEGAGQHQGGRECRVQAEAPLGVPPAFNVSAAAGKRPRRG